MSQLAQSPSPSLEFLNGVSKSIQIALDNLFRHEERLDSVLANQANREELAIQRLESNLSAWQSILAEMADEVRLAQEGLELLNADLSQALNSFRTARKHLQAA